MRLKICSVLLASAMLCGCDNSSVELPSGERETVVLDVLCSREEWDILPELCGDFGRENSDSIYAFTLDTLPKDMEGELLSGKEQADVICFSSDMTEGLAGSGVLLPLTDYSSEISEGRIPMSVAASQVDGVSYGFPYSAETCLLYYDRRKFTQQEIADMNVMMSKKLDTQYSLAMQLNSGVYQSVFFLGTGCDIPYGCRCENGVLAVEYMAALVQCGRFSAELDSGGIKSGFVQGSIAAAISDIGSSEAIKSTLGSSCGMARLPRITLSDGSSQQLGSLAVYNMAGVFAGSDHAEQAVALARWIAGEKSQQLRLEKLNYAPVLTSLCSDRLLMGEYPEIFAMLQQLNYSVAMPSAERLGSFNAAAEQLCGLLLGGEVTRHRLYQALEEFPDL